MQITRRAFLFGLTAVLLAAAAFISRADVVQADTNRVSLGAPSEVSANTGFTVPVDISRVEGLNAASYRITFDTNLIVLDGISDGRIGDEVFPVDGYKEVLPGTCNIINFAGGLRGLTGSGTLAVIRFRSLGKAGTTEIRIAEGVLSNINAEKIEADWTGASITVRTPSHSPRLSELASEERSTPLPTSIAPAEPAPQPGENNWVWKIGIALIVLAAAAAGLMVFRRNRAK